MEIRFNNCPCCDGASFHPFHINPRPKEIKTWKEFFYGGPEYIKDILECDSCGYRFINELEKECDQYYHDQDTSLYLDMEEYRLQYYKKVKAGLQSSDIFKDSTLASVLDLGCGDGSWLEQWKEVKNRHGTELSCALAPILENKSVTIVPDPLHHGTKYDMISAFDFLEHIADPKAFLQDVKGALQPGGILIIGVPDMEILLSRLLKVRFVNYTPMHISYFNAKALSGIIETVFDQSTYTINKSPCIHSNFRGILKWIGFDKFLPEIFNIPIPVGYSASIICTVKNVQ